jgi:hypothetical protein
MDFASADDGVTGCGSRQVGAPGASLGRLKEQYAGQMDFSRASGIVKSLLG